MTNEILKGKLFKILPTYEKWGVESYLSYLERLEVELVGLKINPEILVLVQGLSEKGGTIEHKTLRSIVLHIVNFVDKENIKE